MWADRWGVQGEVGWRVNTREPLYGFGPSSSVDDESNFGYRGVFGGVSGFWQAAEPLGVELFTAFRQIKPEDGRDHTVLYDRDSIVVHEAYSGENLFGMFTPLDLYEFGVNLKLDWRRRPGSPLGGGTELLRVSYVTGNGPGDTTIGFWKIYGEATQYINLFGGRVIGLSVKAEHTEQDADALVPFYELARLGGSRNLRGYKTGRFIAKDMVVFTAEYRWPLMRSLDAVLFTDQGRVFDDLAEDFEFSRFRSSYGGGFRLWSGSGNAEILMAKGTEPLRVYFSFGESF
jgi:outer membrane protein assembly factor BamA